ncbi:MAG TPA: hypothetical protein VGJ06_20475 [Candidatus Acidoferrum sp.]|jgi:hypothetical protein
MANESSDFLPRIISAQKAVCAERKVDFVPSPASSKLDFAVSTKGKLPINGLRHPVAGDTNGWYIWRGETLSDDAAFFVPLHMDHVYEDYPEIAKFLGLPPGYRFLVAPDHNDVWLDQSLLKI